MRKKCSSDQEKLLKFEDEGREFAKIFRSLEQFVQTVKGENNLRSQNACLISLSKSLQKYKRSRKEKEADELLIWKPFSKERVLFIIVSWNSITKKKCKGHEGGRKLYFR